VCVGNQATKGKSANRSKHPVPKHPKYLQGFIWSGLVDDDFYSPTVHFTITDPPLPRPAPEEFENIVAMETIQNYLDLFAALSPINVDAFECLLSTHPNRPFVNSVCVALHKGFWPWAHTRKESYP
jgi:hypothetical protein